MVQEFKMSEGSGMLAFDAMLKKEVLLVATVLCFLGDNPRSYEVISHAAVLPHLHGQSTLNLHTFILLLIYNAHIVC